MANKRSIFINKRGFTLIEVLFSLTICLLIVLNALPIIKIITVKDDIKVNTGYYAIGAKQISQILYTAKNIAVGNSLSFKDEKDKLFTISLHNQRVVKEPGFDIIIRDVKNLEFYTRNENIYMRLNDGENDFHYLIAINYEQSVQPGENNDEIIQ